MTIDYQLTVDCADPGPLVAFWASALGYVPKPPPGEFATWRDYYLSINVPEDELGEGDCTDRLIDPAGRGPGIWFQPVPEGKVVKNRLHLDLFVGGGRSVPLATRRERVDAKVAELVAAGATVVSTSDTPEYDHYFALMNDPEGNEFCVA
ncbi:VOC family protein [Virgisporangium aurantiacum]|uniref:Glyoxalase n=1 Tax=Virgisporangium aurantiacum TaxID=175570 RepID=A0A8J3ZG31_9ACTN|nr:VOC family protein [Virgisporangium aurantiacum]GIJ63284.1 glyoxalase [Virgisporangium aurantiacum]